VLLSLAMVEEDAMDYEGWRQSERDIVWEDHNKDNVPLSSNGFKKTLSNLCMVQKFVHCVG